MKVRSTVTYLILERGTEDEELLAEIQRAFADLGITSLRTRAMKYPRLHELACELKECGNPGNNIEA